jgi:hypothetical protein
MKESRQSRRRPGDARPCARRAVARRFGLLLAAFPFAALLAQCSQSPYPNASTEVAKVSAASTRTAAPRGSASFADRFAPPQDPDNFNDRFDAAQSLAPSLPVEPAAKRIATTSERFGARGRYQVASLAPQVPYGLQRGNDVTTLVGLRSSAFPYLGTNPRTEQPFLEIAEGGRRGHRGPGGRVYWQNETYNDNRVLMHVPRAFDVDKPGVIVLFFHGNGATLERDVRDRQMVPQQITQSGANAVLLAPQLAVDAADSSAGKFWQPGGLRRFLAESAEHLAHLSGNPGAAKKFAAMPVVIVGYSGGFLPTAYSLAVGGAEDRIRGVVLLDAVYGELDKFADWIDRHRSAFFISSYTHYTKRHDDVLIGMLRDRGIAVAEDFERTLAPGSVVFVQTPAGVTHRDYVTTAWTRDPVAAVLSKMAQSPSLIRLAANDNAVR